MNTPFFSFPFSDLSELGLAILHPRSWITHISPDWLFFKQPSFSETDSCVDASWNTPSQGSIAIYPLYSHNIHFLLLYSYHAPHSLTLCLEWLLCLVIVLRDNCWSSIIFRYFRSRDKRGICDWTSLRPENGTECLGKPWWIRKNGKKIDINVLKRFFSLSFLWKPFSENDRVG